MQVSEWVSLGHPDKTADYISEYVLDRYVERDPSTRYALEVQIKDNFVTLGGEISSNANITGDDIDKFVCDAVHDIGYTPEYRDKWGACNTISSDSLIVEKHISQQSNDIAVGVDGGGWGDQGIMFGMAVDNHETNYMPKDIYLARAIGKMLFDNHVGGLDIKTQVYLNGGQVVKIIVAIPMLDGAESDVTDKVKETISRVVPNFRGEMIINGTGRYVKHSSMGDCGTTGRKLAVDFYGGNCVIGGGCVDAETEYLAPDGWHKISGYQGGRVAQVDENMEMSFVIPDRYIQTRSDDVYDVSMENTLSMVLSGNHNVFYKTSKGNFRKKSLAALLAESEASTKGSHAEIPRFFKYGFPDGVQRHPESMARLLVAHCADGTVLGSTPGTRHNCRISVKRQRKIDRIRWVLQSTGLEFTEKTNNDGFTRFYYHLDNPSKLLSEHFHNPDLYTAKLLACETLLWDGSERLGEFRTTQKADADFMQFVFSGVTGNVHSIITREKNEPGYSTLYIVRSVRHKFCSPFRKSSIDESRIRRLEAQEVFCFTVPTGLLLLRRKNYIFVTGNSPWTKDGTKADLSLNLLARKMALEHLRQKGLSQVNCSIACCIGSPKVDVHIYENDNKSKWLKINQTARVRDVMDMFNLKTPVFAKLCREGLFYVNCP